tara:strand:+ start:900 stop:1091 length:192 start_codon:yes stop_codon:yes gene_type:complete
MDDDRRLSPADEALLKNLRQQADRMSERQYRKDAGPNARNEYWYAADELKQFVSKLRKEGKNI